MDKAIIDGMLQELGTGLNRQFGFDSDITADLTSAGQEVLQKSLKSFVLKHGSSEIEDILLGKLQFRDSALYSIINKDLSSQIEARKLAAHHDPKTVSEFSSSLLVDFLVKAFTNSNYPKDRDGICAFLGIDPKLLKVINSPAGKLFGKFFK